MEGLDVNAVKGLALTLKVADSLYIPIVLLYNLCRLNFLIVNTFFIREEKL